MPFLPLQKAAGFVQAPKCEREDLLPLLQKIYVLYEPNKDTRYSHDYGHRFHKLRTYPNE